MLGRHWEELSEEEAMDLIDYAQVDSDRCLELWLTYCDEWPDTERRVSRLTRSMCARGFQFDEGTARDYEMTLTSAIYANAQAIPWYGQVDQKGKLLTVLC